MLKLENVSKYYYNNGIIAVGFSKVNLELKLGEFVVITGESGSGKSTLLNVISGLDSYEDGEMFINGKETSHYTEKDFEDYRRKYIANIFQSFNLVNSYTVYQNIELVMLLNGYKKYKVKKQILKIIDEVGLTKFKNTKVSKLSGGQKQRVAIARAMVKDTPIIVADEPTGNLDTESAKDVLEILKRVAKDKLVVMVTHNIEQVEQYATRVIKMHDGRIIENNEIKKIEEEPKIEASKYKNLTLFNKFRLGIRNTFNIKSKFVLLLVVFAFMSTALVAEYGSFKAAEEDSLDEGVSSWVLQDTSKERILVRKQDKTAFIDSDLDNIKTLSNINTVVENDMFIDSYISLQKQENDSMVYYSYSGSCKDISNFSGNLEYGRMPENDSEVIISMNKDDYELSQGIDNVLNQQYTIYDPTGRTDIKTVTVVGIVFNEKKYDYNSTIYVDKGILDSLRVYLNQYYSKLKILANDKYKNYEIVPTDKVESGCAYVNDAEKYNYKNDRIRGTKINITASNIYYEKELELTITNTFTEYNFKRLTGLKDYYRNYNSLFINTEDYYSMFDEPSYQISVYVKDKNTIDQTMQELNNMGLTTKKASDFEVNYNAESYKFIKIIRTVVTIVVLIVLFFISYFIIRVILKSRNVYFTTLRMLGANVRTIRAVLDIELFNIYTIAYALLMGFCYMLNENIIEIQIATKILKYLSVKEFTIIYLCLAVMAILLSRKVSRKIFKKTAISTYNEEV